MPKKKITIEDLAEMVQNGFIEVDNKFVELRQEMKEGFTEVRDELAGVKARLTAVERRLDDVVDDHGHRLKRLEKKVGVD
jgi:hypothetical protein